LCYFTYWIVAIALVAIFHEGFHGIFARFYNIKIKSTGFGFLGPFLAFFVEQDDKQMQKAKPFAHFRFRSDLHARLQQQGLPISPRIEIATAWSRA
jgi:hypothetical protein